MSQAGRLRRKRRWNRRRAQRAVEPENPIGIRSYSSRWNLQTITKLVDAVDLEKKSPISALDELRVNVCYTELSNRGSAHSPIFTVVVTAGDVSARGVGYNKRDARVSAARSCLASIAARARGPLPGPSHTHEVTSHNVIGSTDIRPVASQLRAETRSVGSNSRYTWDSETITKLVDAVDLEKISPVSALDELGVNVCYTELSNRGFAHSPIFTVVVTAGDVSARGVGYSKRDARVSAARSCLASIAARARGPLPGPSHTHEVTSHNVIGSTDIRPVASQLRAETRSVGSNSRYTWDSETLEKAKESLASDNKSPATVLNELGVKMDYTERNQRGVFIVGVTVGDITFEGRSYNQCTARELAARKCLASILARAETAPKPSVYVDRTGDNVADDPDGRPEASQPRAETSSVGLDSSYMFDLETLKKAKLAYESGSKRPASVLNELGVKVTYTVLKQSGPIHKPTFTVAVKVYDMTFEGKGHNQRKARELAARKCLASILARVKTAPKPSVYVDLTGDNVADDPDLPDIRSASAAAVSLEPPSPGYRPVYGGQEGAYASPDNALNQTLADHIGKLVNQKFEDLMKNDVKHSKKSVLAGIVITINNKIEGARVIAVTTGSRCTYFINDEIRPTGEYINDCHAEVVARRCFQRYLYSQLLMYASKPNPMQPISYSDLEPLENGEGYQMRPDRQVHLYISTAPCGDGRRFPQHEENDPEPDAHLNRREQANSTANKSTNIQQTLGGVAESDCHLTTISDKVASWCVLGLQGALLTHFMAPVYLHSVVFGSRLQPEHVYRAICGRIESDMNDLPRPFKLHRPLVARVSFTEPQTRGPAPYFSVCWCCTTLMPEVISTMTGQLKSSVLPSLLCKRNMFMRWQYLLRAMRSLNKTSMSRILFGLPELDSLLYNEAKKLCLVYQIVKLDLRVVFRSADPDRRNKKSTKTLKEQFSCGNTDVDPNALFA